MVSKTSTPEAVKFEDFARDIARRREAVAIGRERGLEVTRGIRGVTGGGLRLRLRVDVGLDRDLDRG